MREKEKGKRGGRGRQDLEDRSCGIGERGKEKKKKKRFNWEGNSAGRNHYKPFLPDIRRQEKKKKKVKKKKKRGRWHGQGPPVLPSEEGGGRRGKKKKEGGKKPAL